MTSLTIRQKLTRLLGFSPGPCISIIIPTHRTSAGRGNDPAAVKHAVIETERILRKKYDDTIASKMVKHLARLEKTIDFLHETEGLGLYVSPDVSELVHFLFPVRKKIFVGKKFDTGELTFYSEYLLDYYLLLLSKNRTRLLRGSGEAIHEINDKNFPAVFSDSFEYAKPFLAHAISYSLKGAEEKSNIGLKRLVTFLQQMDKGLNSYIQEGTKLIIAGVPKNLSLFKQISHHRQNIMAAIHGNFDYWHNNDLAALAENEIQKYIAVDKERILETFKNMIATGRIIWGITDVQRAAARGDIATLLVEKNSANYNEIFEAVIKKGGRIIFYENDELKHYDRIAAILRTPAL